MCSLVVTLISISIISGSLIANNQLIIKHRKSPSGPSPASFVCPSNYGYFQNPDNCNSYYYCWSGSSYLQFCPDGTTFSPMNHNCSASYSCSPSTPSTSIETDSSKLIPSEYPPARPHSTFRPWSQSTPYPGTGGYGESGSNGQGGYNGINQPYPTFPITPNAGTGCYQECCTYRSVLVRSVCTITKNLINVSLRKFTRVRGNLADAARRIGLSSSSPEN